MAPFILGLLFILVGTTGFTKRGLLLHRKKRLDGRGGRLTGALLVILGLIGLSVGFWLCAPDHRLLSLSLLVGIAIGSCHTSLLLHRR